MKIQKNVSLDHDVKMFLDDNMENFNFSEWVCKTFREQFMTAENIQKRILANKKLLKKASKIDTSFINEILEDFKKELIIERICKGADPKAVYNSFLFSTGRLGVDLSYKQFAEILLKERKRCQK